MTTKIEDWLVTSIQTNLQTGKNEAFAFTSNGGGSYDYHKNVMIRRNNAKIESKVSVGEEYYKEELE